MGKAPKNLLIIYLFTMKKALLLLVMCATFVVSNAQITTGESVSKVVRTGNRAQAGDAGLYLGATTDMFRSITDGNIKFKAIPLINLKYMQTDKIELRLGIEWWDKNEKSDGDDYETSKSESEFNFYPGVAYHFNNKNLLDVYVGAELPFGFGRRGYDYGKDNSNSASMFQVGLGAFIGLQAYVADLPIALGLEYGVSCGYQHVGNGTMSSDYHTQVIEGISEDFNQSKFKLGNQARMTISYFFKL